MKKYFILAAAAAMFAACSNNEDLAQGEAPTERIPLTIGAATGDLTVNSTMRGNTANLQDAGSVIATNKVGLFIVKESGVTITDNSFEKFNVGTTSLDNTTRTNFSIITPSSDIYYPDNKTQKIDIYAYAPFQTGDWSSNNISTNKQAFTLEDDQTDDDDYMASDVLWGCAGTGTTVAASTTTGGAYTLLAKTNESAYEVSANQYKTVITNAGSASTGKLASSAYYLTTGTPNTADVVVPMLHRGSKIIVKLKATGMDKTKLQNAKVVFHADYKTGELNISDGTFTSTGSAADTEITLTDRLGIEGKVANPSDAVTEQGVATIATTDDAYECSAVIVPHQNTVSNNSGNSPIIEITLRSNNTNSATDIATYGYKTGATTATTFVSGKKYIYNITVTASGLVVSTQVLDWVDDSTSLPNSGTGDAVLQ